MKHSLTLFAATVVTLATVARLQADPFQYTYTWTLSPVSITAGNGSVSFSDHEGGASGGGTHPQTDVTATNISAFSTTSDSNPDVIPVPVSGSNYTLAVTISNGFVGSTPGTITFTGLLQGQLAHDSSYLNNIITGVTDDQGSDPGRTFGAVVVGGAMYFVSYNGFQAPGPDGRRVLSFEVDWSVADLPPPPPFAPEPSSMVLGCLGLMFLGGGVYRARRRKTDLLKAAI